MMKESQPKKATGTFFLEVLNKDEEKSDAGILKKPMRKTSAFPEISTMNSLAGLKQDRPQTEEISTTETITVKLGLDENQRPLWKNLPPHLVYKIKEKYSDAE